jgi:drug/metabolite transporter (DMT)-like permease
LGVGYLTFAKALRPHISVTLFMFMVMVFGSVIVLCFMAASGVPFQFSRDPYDGLFGWSSLEQHRILIALHIAIICNVIGTMGFVRAMQYFDNIIISVATLLEPMIATVIAFAVGVGELPGPLGWTGNFLVVLGTLGVVYPSASKGESVGH